MDPLTAYVVQAAAIVTAAAATYGATALRSIKQQVTDNTRRSKRNQKMITGRNTHLRGVLPRLGRIERRILGAVQTVDTDEEGQ
ncbi:hypothetical protein [Haloarcula pellucida]|uniref:Uncharacterized protein n=1 Tax=Haloarcula pellucida TaxID=1427151 RepID=A0A830GMP8_9EURY|nr:hypothetical protein [Halomicroarcula pellucida]MBX0348236.1 hypothetical protein [Halomicroarcula pellucida]GGN97628.1 hypothetical protein GCM10009030_27060 [Halomicroarcula pellucida]